LKNKDLLKQGYFSQETFDLLVFLFISKTQFQKHFGFSICSSKTDQQKGAKIPSVSL